MGFIEKMEVEKDFHVFRRYKQIKINDRINLSVQASDFSYAEPRETTPLQDYTKMEFAIFVNGHFKKSYEVFENEELNDDLFEYSVDDQVYGYVPVELIEMVYRELIKICL